MVRQERDVQDDWDDAVNASGQASLTHTRLRGRTTMRAGIGNILTSAEHLEHAWERVRREAHRLARPG